MEDVAGVVGSSGTVSGIDVGPDDGGREPGTPRRRRCSRGLRQADAHALPFEERSFDRVRCERVLQHVEDPAEVVAEIFRVPHREGWRC